MNIREISDVFKDTANQITAIKSYNFGWPSDRTRSSNTEDYQELNEFPRVFFSVPTITGSDQTRKQDTYQVTIFFDDLLGYNNEGDADLTLQLDKWAALQEYANYFVQRLNKVKQTILPNYLFIPEAPSITFDSFTGLQRMITVQLSFTLVVPTNCEPIVSKLVECIANIVTSSNLTASLTSVIKLVSSLQASSSLSASVLVSKLAQSNLNTESSLSANIQIAKLASSSLNAGSTLSADALVTRLFEASLNGNGSLFANPLITKFAASSLNTASSLAASALVSKLAVSSLTGAGTLAANLTVTAAGFDADAQAFFNRVTTAGGTLTTTEQNAVNTLVIALKADGIWTKMKAIYPMVGGGQANPAAACAQNLKSASFTGSFTSGWTFASTGVSVFGGAYFNTNLNPLVTFGTNYAAFGVYLRNTFFSGQLNIMGCTASNLPGSLRLDMGYDAGFNTPFVANGFAGSNIGSDTDNRGFLIATRQGAAINKLFRNNVLKVNGTGVFASYPSLSFYFAARNNTAPVEYFNNNQNIAFGFISDNLDDIEAANFYTRVQAFQTTLSRNV
jgi:hypothetical protein